LAGHREPQSVFIYETQARETETAERTETTADATFASRWFLRLGSYFGVRFVLLSNSRKKNTNSDWLIFLYIVWEPLTKMFYSFLFLRIWPNCVSSDKHTKFARINITNEVLWMPNMYVYRFWCGYTIRLIKLWDKTRWLSQWIKFQLWSAKWQWQISSKTRCWLNLL